MSKTEKIKHSTNEKGEDVFELESKALGDYFRARVVPDDTPENPREWSTLTTMVCFHHRYNFGDKHDYTLDEGWDELYKTILALEQPIMIKPLYAYIHSGVVLKTSPFNDPWDSGQVGFIYIPRKHLKEIAAHASSKTKLSKQDANRADRIIEGELESYNQFLSGDVWGVIVEDPNDDTIDSLWSLFGHKYAMEEAQRMLKDAVASVEETATHNYTI